MLTYFKSSKDDKYILKIKHYLKDVHPNIINTLVKHNDTTTTTGFTVDKCKIYINLRTSNGTYHGFDRLIPILFIYLH